jgi:DNA-binding response OmpR family regulator
MRAVVIESRPEVVAELKSVFLEFKIDLAFWSDKGSNWTKEFRAARPDIVFIDYLVNGRDGLKCLEMAIEMTNAPFYVFMHSFRGLRANDLEEKAFAIGADIVLQKPLVRARLKTAISRLIRLREGNQRKMTLVMKE